MKEKRELTILGLIVGTTVMMALSDLWFCEICLVFTWTVSGKLL